MRSTFQAGLNGRTLFFARPPTKRRAIPRHVSLARIFVQRGGCGDRAIDFRTDELLFITLKKIQHCAFGRYRTSAEGKVGGEPGKSVSVWSLATARRSSSSRTACATQIFSEINRLMLGRRFACDCRSYSGSPRRSRAAPMQHRVIQGFTVVDRTFRASSHGHFLDMIERSGPPPGASQRIPKQATQTVQDRA